MYVYCIFLKIKSVKIYAIPYIFSTTLLLYKLDTLLLKQKNLAVLDITGFFFGIRAMHLGLHLSTHAEKKPCYVQYSPLLLFQ